MPEPARRAFLRGAACLGALTFLTGCDIVDGFSAENVLRNISALQRRGAGLAVRSRTSSRRPIPRSAITEPFPFNAYYSEDEAPEVDGRTFKLEVGGLVGESVDRRTEVVGKVDVIVVEEGDERGAGRFDTSVASCAEPTVRPQGHEADGERARELVHHRPDVFASVVDDDGLHSRKLLRGDAEERLAQGGGGGPGSG